MDIHVVLTSAEAEALMAAGGPTHRENQDLETGRDKVLVAYRDFYAAQAVDYMAQSGYVCEEDADKFDRLLRDPLGRDGLS